jgi:predicted NAD/FAD-dependent oxidoreductase
MLVVHAGPALSAELFALKTDEALTTLYNLVRMRRRGMALIPLQTAYRKWSPGFPAGPAHEPPFLLSRERSVLVAGGWLGGNATGGAVRSGRSAAREAARIFGRRV